MTCCVMDAAAMPANIKIVGSIAQWGLIVVMLLKLDEVTSCARLSLLD